MNKQRGFTLVELILALLISAIMAGLIVEIIAGPINTYFWVSARTLLVQDGELALDTMQTELNAAWPQTLQLNTGRNEEIIFHKIIDEGYALADLNQIKPTLTLLTKLAPSTDLVQDYYIAFSDQKDLIKGKLIQEKNKATLVLEKPHPLDNKVPLHFYLLSDPILYQCDDKGLLTRHHNGQTALLTNQVKKCEFTRHKIRLQMGTKVKEPIIMTMPLFIEAKV
ncbi:MAG: type II secretion system protein [Proteobacteria bacterium]|nr:type II secretion system protein [Pseudomonadota bacterium]